MKTNKYELARLILAGKLTTENITTNLLRKLGSKNTSYVSQNDLDFLADEILSEELDLAFKKIGAK